MVEANTFVTNGTIAWIGKNVQLKELLYSAFLVVFSVTLIQVQLNSRWKDILIGSMQLGTTLKVSINTVIRVPTVMEKSWKNKFSWKVLEKLWKTCEKLKVMEKNLKLSKKFLKDFLKIIPLF